MLHRLPLPRGRSLALAGLVLALVVYGALLWTVVTRSNAQAASPPSAMHMSDAQMTGMLRTYRVTHPEHREQTSLAVTPVDSFVTSGLRWDEDHNTATVVDTAHIMVGDAILFKFTAFHTATSGEGSLDPLSGALFDVTGMSPADNFTHVFNDPGRFFFYCLIHESSNMRGVIDVSTPLGAPPAGSPSRIGFVAAPWPNPTRAGTSFRIALAQAGHTRIDVIDTQGRRLTTLLDRELPAGAFLFAWDGSGADGRPAPAGIYLIRLRGPGVTESRRVTVER